MQAYLQTDPKYACRFKKVWLWNEFSGKGDLGGSDTGIDLVALTHEGNYSAIQCKCYQAGAVIDKPAVDSFLATSSREFKNENLQTTRFAHRLWISTTNKWGANVTEATGLADATPDSVVITVSEIAIAGLTAANSSPTKAGNVTSFTATISAGSNVTYQWNFGDNSPISNLQSPTHTYTTTGIYTAIVTATNSLSSTSASTSVTITSAGFKLYLPLITKSPSAAANMPTKPAARELGRVAWRSER